MTWFWCYAVLVSHGSKCMTVCTYRYCIFIRIIIILHCSRIINVETIYAVNIRQFNYHIRFVAAAVIAPFGFTVWIENVIWIFCGIHPSTWSINFSCLLSKTICGTTAYNLCKLLFCFRRFMSVNTEFVYSCHTMLRLLTWYNHKPYSTCNKRMLENDIRSISCVIINTVNIYPTIVYMTLQIIFRCDIFIRFNPGIHHTPSGYSLRTVKLIFYPFDLRAVVTPLRVLISIWCHFRSFGIICIWRCLYWRGYDYRVRMFYFLIWVLCIRMVQYLYNLRGRMCIIIHIVRNCDGIYEYIRIVWQRYGSTSFGYIYDILVHIQIFIYSVFVFWCVVNVCCRESRILMSVFFLYVTTVAPYSNTSTVTFYSDHMFLPINIEFCLIAIRIERGCQ